MSSIHAMFGRDVHNKQPPEKQPAVHRRGVQETPLDAKVQGHDHEEVPTKRGYRLMGMLQKPLSKKMEERLEKHAKTYSASHIETMREHLLDGKSFKKAHELAS